MTDDPRYRYRLIEEWTAKRLPVLIEQQDDIRARRAKIRARSRLTHDDVRAARAAAAAAAVWTQRAHRHAAEVHAALRRDPS